MDHNSQTFHTRIIEAIQAGEVVCLIFPRIGKTLIVDMRHTLEIPPSIMVDDTVSRPTERVERLEVMRPTMPAPEELRIAPWVGSISSLKEAGIADALLERCADTGDVAVVEQCRAAIDRLERLEGNHIRALIRGNQSRTLWERDSTIGE